MDYVRKFEYESGRNALSSVYRMLYGNLITVRECDLADRVLSQDKAARNEWRAFCSDVVILHAIRYVLYKKSIPMDFVPSTGVSVD